MLGKVGFGKDVRLEEEEKIRLEAKALLKKFADKLDEIGIEVEDKSLKPEKNSGIREELEGEESDDDFRKRMFENSPNKTGDCILAEKKKW
jgi:hypothetical protein